MKDKKRQFIVILVLSCILLIEIVFYLQKEDTSSTFSVKSTTKSEITDELVIALFMENIVADSNTFYDADYFTNELEYFNYIFKIKDIKKQGEPPHIYITFETTPMVGAHWPVGDDEITYKVDVFGKKALEKFTHKKTYDIPPWLKKDTIKPLNIHLYLLCNWIQV